ncbi:hypothetical protein ABZ348_15480 [Streptomyces sp. NPDC005963]|uniref:hypothetical protein n=1 Tax=Streptomyces sp. NPDC005963 TaxID=3156721 RepID=UPI00340C25A3
MTNKPNTTLDELRTALDTLATWPDVSWADVTALAGKAVPLVWAALKESTVWDELCPADRAALYWSLFAGHGIEAQRHSTAANGQPAVHDLIRECAYFAVHCERARARWPEAEGRYEEREGAEQHLEWYRSYPPEWRAEVFRTLEVEHQLIRHSDEGRPSLSHVLGRVHDRVFDHDTTRIDKGYGAETAVRLAALPEGWQIETIRRVAAGTLPGHAVSAAYDAISALPRFGVELCPMPPP